MYCLGCTNAVFLTMFLMFLTGDALDINSTTQVIQNSTRDSISDSNSIRVFRPTNASLIDTLTREKVYVECSKVTKLNSSSQQCHFVKTTDDCHLSEGFLQYLYLPYCDLPRNFAFFILFAWLVFLFIVLGTTADDYFCPSLAVISKTLKMSQNVAGVTFLAYGNGAPDIFSAIAAFSHAKSNSSAPEMGIQALFGAGVFVTTVVVGSVVLCSGDTGVKVTQRPFIRDVLFYIIAVGWMVIALYDEELSMLESIGLILFYAAYVIVVIVGRYLYQYWKKKKKAERVEKINTGHGDAISSVLGSESFATSSSLSTQQDERVPLIRTVTHSTERSPVQKLLYGILPFTCSDWQQSGLCAKIWLVFKAPAVALLNVTVPVIDSREPDHQWNKWLNAMHCVTGPVFLVMAIKVGMVVVAGRFPVWAITLCLGVILALFVGMVTSSSRPPRFHWMFAYLGFLVSLIWIYVTANEIVNLLQTFGVVFKLSDAILGLTFLAWGNSIGDLVSNTTMARQGYPNMAVAACFGGPMLNLLLGIGIACTYVSARQGYSVKISHHYHQYIISASFLTLSLVSSGVAIPLMGFRIPRFYGLYLLLLYLAYIAVSIAAEAQHF